jgi:WD40 repeat protein
MKQISTGGSNAVKTSRQSSESFRSKTEYVEGSLQLTDTINSGSDVMCLRYSADGTVLAAGLANGSIKVYSVETGECLHMLTTDDELNKLPVTSIRFYPSSHRLAASYATGQVRLWHYSSSSCLAAIDDKRSQTLSMSLNLKGDRFATVGSDPQVSIYDIETKKRVLILDATDSRDKMDGHRARVFAVVYHPTEDHILLSGGWDDTVQYWDERQKHSFRKFFGPHICGDALDIDPVYSHILTGSWRKDTPLQIWDFGTGEKIKDVPQDVQYTSQLYCAQWVSHDSIACGGCFNNMARLIDRGTLNTVGVLSQLSQGVYCIDNSRQSSKPHLAVGASSKIYQLKQQ